MHQCHCSLTAYISLQNKIRSAKPFEGVIPWLPLMVSLNCFRQSHIYVFKECILHQYNCRQILKLRSLTKACNLQNGSSAYVNLQTAFTEHMDDNRVRLCLLYLPQISLRSQKVPRKLCIALLNIKRLWGMICDPCTIWASSCALSVYIHFVHAQRSPSFLLLDMQKGGQEA